MKKILIISAVTLFAFISIQAQPLKGSEFLYGKKKNKTNTLLIFGVDGGMVTRNTFGGRDYRIEDITWGQGFTLKFPVYRRIGIGMFFRASRADITGREGKNNPNASYEILEPVDWGGMLTYTVYSKKLNHIHASAGAGWIYSGAYHENEEGSFIRKSGTRELIVPIELLYTRTITPNVSAGLGYRYYLSAIDDLDGTIANNNNDRYSYTYASIFFHLPKGNKAYRGNNCPVTK
jgi:hypothetical protein